ncbi:MAG: M23 family metallopeptidase [Alphaproteobacteria bacterium]|nr:M23 family metallopeptidase [Alphaproteobacteria bacterium]MBT7942880.1 M23 family metallopeptidase [Alphaproteobacteria bacterium]
MKALLALVASVLLLAFSPTESVAGELGLDGPMMQGGLVTGHTEPGAQVTVDGKPVRVSKGGAFLIGFGRNAKPTSALIVRHVDGFETRKILRIKQRDYKVQRINGLPSRKVTPKPEDLARIKDDNAKIAGVRRLDTIEAGFASGFIWPATGPLSGVFGSQRILNGKPKNPHNGVDVAAPFGAPVTAAADGTVALVHPDMFYTGKTVMIDHGHGLSSVYVHMDKILVQDGQRVSKRTPIGAIGKTGRVTGPHLHWGVSLFGVHLDPSLLVGPMPSSAPKNGG